MTIADLISSLQTTLVAVNTVDGKVPKPRFLPRPVSALDVVRARNTTSDDEDSVTDALGAFGF